MRFARLADWLSWQERLHPRAIDPGLERVRTVADRLGLLAPTVPVLTVGGTNGKGSTVAFLESIARATGLRPGAYTSPHLMAYNERIRLDGEPVGDGPLMRAFDAIDQARGELTLSYFEFGTLAALWCFREACVDVWLLEVGLGGRLDAVNVLDADVAAVTSVDLDHKDWLGDDRDSIGVEKAGIMRVGRPAVCGDADPPAGLLAAAAGHGAVLRRIGEDFHARPVDGGWRWDGPSYSLFPLPLPASGEAAIDNAATALAAWDSAGARLPRPTLAQARAGIAGAHLPGRLQWLEGDWLLDVAHNPAAARRLAAAVSDLRGERAVNAVFACMQRKEMPAVVAALAPVVDEWHLLDTGTAAAWPVAEVADAVRAAGGRVAASGPAATLLPALGARPGIKLVSGSFAVVEAVLAWPERPAARAG